MNLKKKRLFLKKKMKLKKSNFFNFNIKKNNKILCLKIKYNNLLFPRIGIIIKKKYIKLSFLRNKIKRIIYELFRINQYKIKKLDFLFIIKKNFIFIKKKKIIKIIKNFFK